VVGVIMSKLPGERENRAAILDRRASRMMMNGWAFVSEAQRSCACLDQFVHLACSGDLDAFRV
jgi:hypothetical protein